MLRLVSIWKGDHLGRNTSVGVLSRCLVIVHRPLIWIWGTDAIHLYLGNELQGCCCCCCLSLVEWLFTSRVSPTDFWHCNSSMHFYMHVTPYEGVLSQRIPITLHVSMSYCVAWQGIWGLLLGWIGTTSAVILCTAHIFTMLISTARCYKGQPFRPAQLPHGEPA